MGPLVPGAHWARRRIVCCLHGIGVSNVPHDARSSICSGPLHRILEHLRLRSQAGHSVVEPIVKAGSSIISSSITKNFAKVHIAEPGDVVHGLLQRPHLDSRQNEGGNNRGSMTSCHAVDETPFSSAQGGSDMPVNNRPSCVPFMRVGDRHSEVGHRFRKDSAPRDYAFPCFAKTRDDEPNIVGCELVNVLSQRKSAQQQGSPAWG